MPTFLLKASFILSACCCSFSIFKDFSKSPNPRKLDAVCTKGTAVATAAVANLALPLKPLVDIAVVIPAVSVVSKPDPIFANSA